MNPLQIVTGPFALVHTGNATYGYVLDDEMVQKRAEDAIDPYWGKPKIFERGIKGFGILLTETGTILDIYKTEDDAAESIKRRLS
jgi:hypothetical protein